MKRLITILLFVFAISFQTMAQVDYSFGNIKKKRNLKNVPTIGVKGGFTMNNMAFSVKSYDKLPGEGVNAPAYGLFMEFPNSKIRGLAIGGEVLMVERGVTKDFMFRNLYHEIDKISTKYIDIRIPVTYYFMSYNIVNPYVFVAADFAVCYSGSVSKSFPDNDEFEDLSIDMSKSDAVLRPYDISAVAGVGVRFNIPFQVFTLVIKLDADYNFGLLNTMPSKHGTPIDVYAYTYEKNESRKNRGLEFMISIGLPLKFDFGRDACYGW